LKRLVRASIFCFFATFVALSGVAPLVAPARAQAPETLPKQPLPPAPSARPADEVFDPYHAQKAVEIGEFYMKKGDIDAAIDRYLEAIRLKKDFARPRLLLGEAFEKKDEKADALKYYKEYLQILPKAPDAAKVRKRIEKLSRDLKKENASGSR
jgi:tetratricopeptide (TPR) repeat protein